MSLGQMVTRPLTRRSLALLAGLGVVAAASIAQAATIQLSTGVLLVKQSTNEKVKRGTGAGVLMPVVTTLNGNKLMAMWMDSAPDITITAFQDPGDNNGYWEGKIAIIQMAAEAAPTVTLTKQISDFGGNRPFNHPRFASTGDYVVVNFASTMDDPSTTNQYVMALDSSGNKVAGPLDVGLRDGDNHGAAEMHFVGKVGTDYKFVGGFLHNNNDSYVFGLTMHTSGGMSLTRDWLTLIARPANIGRPTCAVTGATTATCCAAKGDNRPPEYGVQCAALDTTTGNLLSKKIVAASDPQHRIYMNQPTITSLGNGLCGLGVVMSDGRGREQNGHFLGTNTSLAYVIDCTTLEVKDMQKAVAPFQRHAIMTSSLFGNQGQTYMGSLGCSSTGAGAAGLQLIGVDQSGKMSIDKNSNLMPVMWQCDTAWLAYRGLRNPRDQGREFLNTLGSVPNPGFQDPKGWMPEVSHFAVSLVPAVKDMNALRNSLYASFVPIAWDKNVQVSMGAAVDVGQIPTGPSPIVDDGSPTVGGGDGSGNGSGSSGGGASGGTHHRGGGWLGMTDGGGCNVGSSPTEGLEGLALLGLGLAFAASRRNVRR